jgi:glucose/mannose-6-phosphate isomerase
VSLSKEDIQAVDPGGMLGDVLAQPHQYEDALWRTESANVPKREFARGIVICGMGGSAIGADLAAAAIGTRATAPITTVRGYELPAWVGDQTLVVCASYSGNTEETLHCFDQAGVQGAPRVVVTTGGQLAERARAAGDAPVIGVPSGMQPRAAVVYGTVTSLLCAELAGASPPLRDELDEAARVAGQIVDADDEAKQLAEAIGERIPVVYGGPTSVAAARRWRGQFNENSKRPAFFGELPEAHHNEVVGWYHAEDRLIALLLETDHDHERIGRRLDVSEEVLREAGVEAIRVKARGETALAQLMSLVLLGDLASVYLAVLNGIDPTPVEEIEGLKKRL